MRYNCLGNTNLTVSELCFGTLPIGPLQVDMPVERGAAVIRYGLERGINFIDTAQRYATYPHVRAAIKGYQKPLIIASKSLAAGYADMQKALDEARIGLGRDVIDIFHLHAARAGANVFTERQGAFECLCEAKAKGIIRAVGISTHSPIVVQTAAAVAEIDVIHPLINMAGLGIIDGTLDDMRAAIEAARVQGKGIYQMKAMAGGHLVDNFEEALRFGLNIAGIASIAVGMLNQAEVDANIACFEGREIGPDLRNQIGKKRKKLFVLDHCKGCGICAQICHNGAIAIVDGKAKVDPELCLTCGYCVPQCPLFNLRWIDQ